MRRVVFLFAVLLGVLTTGCGASAPPAPDQASSVPHAVTVPQTGTTSTRLIDRLRWTYKAHQILAVTTRGRTDTVGRIRAFARRDGHWVQVFGPWPAHVGYRGFAPRGDKREGDGRSPTGSFRFPFMFGVDADPGVHLRYRRALSTSRWDDDSTSANYNRWVDTRYGDPGRSPEHMQLLPQYRYGAVIGYNLDRTPYLGSAIFLHVSDGGPTLGCVSVRRDRLVRLLRWLRPVKHPRIVMGTRADVTR